MARVFPFQPYRYSPKAGPIHDLVTQPYDKITDAMRSRYLSLSPHNLVRIILGERRATDTADDDVYTRAAQYFNNWIATGIFAQEASPSLYAYFQEFEVPDTGERLVRKGFIGLGAVEDYEARIVHRHEQTLSGPKKDRLELLRQTHAHFGQIFVLYPDPEGAVDVVLDEAGAAEPLILVTDEYGARHAVWRISDAGRISRVQQLMADRKLVIADGHHRYETALAFRNENPGWEDASRVMMTFVNMHSPGLRILATHRVLHGLPDFDRTRFLEGAARDFRVEPAGSLGAVRESLAAPPDGHTRLGVAIGNNLYALERKTPTGELDLTVLHRELIGQVLGVSEEAVREQRYLDYIRGIDAAVEKVRSGSAQVGFLVRPTTVEDVARISLGGGVMPQKSTDFYPKLISGLTIYRLRERRDR